MRKFFATSFFVLGLSFLSLSCGYSTHSTLPSNIKTVFVEPFPNKVSYTSESGRNLYFPLLEVKVRNAIIDRFHFDGALRIADSDTADLILKGELINYERNGLRFTDNNDDVQEYRIQITVSLQLLNSAHEVLWQEPSLVGETTYYVTGAQAKSEESALQDAIKDLARRAVERVVEDW